MKHQILFALFFSKRDVIDGDDRLTYNLHSVSILDHSTCLKTLSFKKV